jgi:DNA-binding XRE family transcriptional regulator
MCVVLESEAAIGGFTSLSAQSVISRQRRTPRPKTSPVLARNLTALRELSGLTVEQLADRVGVSRDAIIRHSQGAQRPQPEALAGYAQAFSLLFGTTVTTDDLFDPALMTRIESLPKR